MIERREFIALLTAATAACPFLGHAQQSAIPRRIGVLLYSSPQNDPQMAPLRQGLEELGYLDGRNIRLEYRYADGRAEKLPELAAELVSLRPDVIVAIGGDVAPFARQATQTIPLVFAISADPERLGLVESLSRPGGNATGVTFLQDELASKRLQLLKDAAPHISKVAVLGIPITPTTSCAMRNVQPSLSESYCIRLKSAVAMTLRERFEGQLQHRPMLFTWFRRAIRY